MAQVPSNLIPTAITQLPQAPVASEDSLLIIVYNGNNYKIRAGDLLQVAGVPTSRQVIAGTGLAGGGALATNVTLSVAPGGIGSTELANSGVTAGVYGTATQIPVFTVDSKGRVTAASTIAVQPPSNYVPNTREVIAGPGLSGGGALNTNVTLTADFSDITPLSNVNAGSAGSSTELSRADHRHPAIDLADQTQIDGVLPIDQGGTSRSLVMNPGAIIWSGADGLYVGPPGDYGQVLVSGGTDAPLWADIPTTVPQPAHYVLIGPVSGPNASPTYRLLVNDDLPATLSGKTITNATITDSTVDNSAIGATTPNTGKFTQLNVDNVEINNNTISSTNANGNINIDPNGTGVVDIPSPVVNVEYLGLDTTPSVTPTAAGSLSWNSGDGTADLILNSDVTLQIGQENLVKVFNNSASTITNGQVVAVNGAQGQRPAVVLADADTEALSAATLGVATEDIASGAEGFVTTFGIVRGVNTTGFTDGQPIYLSQTAGQFTHTRPSAPAHTVFLGWVLKINAASGELFLNISNGWEIDELHNVKITDVQNNDLLQYTTSGPYWHNVAPSTITVGSATTATNLAAGAVNQIAYQTGAGATSFITAPTVANTYLEWSGSAFQWSANPLGSVTSVGLSAPTGFTVTNSPVTTSGTLTLSFSAGYSLPTTTSQSNWDTAYSERLQWDGGSTNLVAATGRTSLGGSTVGQNVFTLTNPSAITFPRFNADNTVSALNAADFRTAIGAGTGNGTVTSVAALTLGTTGTDLSSTVATGTTTPVITLNVPTASASNRGALSSTDWSTFNGKQAAYANLTTIGGLANSAGWLYNNGSGVFSYSTPTKTDVGLSNVTNDAQTKATIVPNTTPTAGQILVGNAGGTAYAPVSMSNDATLTSTGAITLSTVNSNVGSFTNANITVDAKGRVTAASSGSAGGVTSFSAGTTGLTPSTATTGAITLAGTLAIANGGTGQTTQTAAFDALSPTTTKGDLIVYDGTDNVRLAAGTNTYVLTADSTAVTGLKWAAPTGGGASVSIGTSPPGTPTAGDLWWSSEEGKLKIYYTDATPTSQWVDAATGTVGATGPAGPNSVSTSTASSITGLIKGSSGFLAAATANTDYIAGPAPTAMATLMGFTTTATAGATTTLTSSSSYYQVFTGTLNQTVQLPATSTLSQGWSFHIVNNSTGTLTVQTSTAVSLGTVPPGTTAMPTALTITGNTAADWEFGYTDFSTLTGTGSVVLSNSPTLVTPALGTPSSGNLSSCTNLSLTTGVTGTLPVANGGTGLTAGTSGGVLYYSATGTLASSAALTANAIVLGGGAGAAPATTTTGTGVVTALGIAVGSSGAFVTNGGALGTPSSGALTNCTADGTNKVGYRNVPRSGSAKNTNYTLLVGDVGEYIELTTGGSITVPDATFATGDVVSIFNNTNAAITMTMSITTAYIGGTDADKATISLATRGVATILFLSSTVCVVTGNVS